MPGFRPGNVPIGIVKKHIGQQVIAEELEKKLEEVINKYCDENSIEIFRPVIPVHSDKVPDLKTDTEFEFNYIIGILPSIDFEVSELFKDVEKLNISLEEGDIDKEIEMIRYAYVDYKFLEEVEEFEDLNISASIKELDAEFNVMEEGLSKMFMKKWADLSPELKEFLKGKKPKEDYRVNLNEIFPDKEYMADLLKIDKLEAEDCNSNANLRILNIARSIMPDMNEEFFRKASHNEASNEEEFRKYAEKQLIERQKNQSEHLLHDLVFEALNNSLLLELPDNYIEKLFEEERKEEISELDSEKLKEEKERFIKSIKWSMIVGQLSKKYNIEADEKEIISEAYLNISNFYQQKGYYQIQNEEMSKIVIDYLKNRQNYMATKDRVIAGKVIEHLISLHDFKIKTVNKEEFERIHKEKHSHEH